MMSHTYVRTIESKLDAAKTNTTKRFENIRTESPRHQGVSGAEAALGLGADLMEYRADLLKAYECVFQEEKLGSVRQYYKKGFGGARRLIDLRYRAAHNVLQVQNALKCE